MLIVVSGRSSLQRGGIISINFHLVYPVLELFQNGMNSIVEGLDGVVCQMDDVLIFGAIRAEHNARLTTVLERLQEARVMLNPEKCKFRQTEVKFIGQLIDARGICMGPNV